MAFRIHDSVVRGEIDNRVKGMVRGKIWLEGRAEPLELELEGNAWPDLAGCLLTFSNPKPRVRDPGLESLRRLQRGSIGDLTASRRVRVFDVPLDQALEMIDRKEKPPEHMANSLYLEWYSEANGRVVVESADYELTTSAPEWRMTTQDEQERTQQAAAGMDQFLQRLTEAIEAHKRGQKDPEEPWNEHDYEKFFKECDARGDKYRELLEKYGHSPEAQAKIAQEMGWDIPEDQDEDGDQDDRISIAELNATGEAAEEEPEPTPDPEREGIDWIRTPDGDVRHPLQHRCFESSIRFHQQVDELGVDHLADADLSQFLDELQITSAKLAGALNSLTRASVFPEPGFTVAYLKRALDHLHKSQAGLEAVAPRKVLPEAMVVAARKELFELREGILRVMDEFRGRRPSD